ncbi:Vesicle transport protein GOT1, partial [Mucuna pruriens]
SHGTNAFYVLRVCVSRSAKACCRGEIRVANRVGLTFVFRQDCGKGFNSREGNEFCVLVPMKIFPGLRFIMAMIEGKTLGHLNHQYKMVSFEMNDRKKIGLGLTGFGIFFSFLGVIFFFDKGLLAMGNILFVSGVSLTIGLKSTMQFFMKRSNFKGTISFGIGFFILILGWPILGMIVESYGFIVLFSGFWPTLAVFMQKIPLVGWLFQQPYVRSLLDRYRGRRFS